MAYEDLTTFTEVDPNGVWSQTSTRNSFTNAHDNDTGYVYKDYGVDNFGTTFEHIIDVKFDCTLGFGDAGGIGLYTLTNSPGTKNDMTDGVYLEFYTFYEFMSGQGTNVLWLQDLASSNFDSTPNFLLSLNTTYYLKISRSVGTVTCKIYPTDSDRTNDTNIIDTLTLNIDTPTTTYRYLQCGCGNEGTDNIDDWTGYTENIDLSGGTPTPEEVSEDETLNLSIEEEVNLSLEKVTQSETLDLSIEEIVAAGELDFSDVGLGDESEFFVTKRLEDDIEFSILETANLPANKATKVIYSNSPTLYIVTDENPAKLIEVDISGATPIFNQVQFNAIGETAKNATDIVLNDDFSQLYISCAEGQVMKVNVNDLSDRTQIDTGDTDDLLCIDCLDSYKYTYVGTNNSTGEIIKIDESTIYELNTDFRFAIGKTYNLETLMTTILASQINSDFRFSKQYEPLINTDFRFSRFEYEEITPIARTDFYVYIDGIQTDDVDLATITVNHTADQDSEASFDLAREHDNPNKTLDNVSSEITNKNDVIIKIKIGSNYRTIFTGKISELDFKGSEEKITVHCVGDTPDYNFNTTNLPLASKTVQRHLYDVVLDDINIYNPDIDPDEEDPETYLGIKVDLGRVTEEVISYSGSPHNREQLALDIVEGTWLPEQNWTYFWEFDGYNFYDNTSLNDKYIGTSPSGASSDTWEITGLYYHKQRQFPNLEFVYYNGSYYIASGTRVVGDITEIYLIGIGWVNEEDINFYYTLGSAPYKEISTKNGKYISKRHYEDKEDGLYIVYNERSDYTDYAKETAAIEFDKIKTINDEILPITKATISLTVDAYLYYNIELLKRFNITNTTESGVFEDNNGFPLAVKTIQINTSDMQVRLSCDNIKSKYEMDLLDEGYPDEDDSRFIIPAHHYKIKSKYDLSRREEVE